MQLSTPALLGLAVLLISSRTDDRLARLWPLPAAPARVGLSPTMVRGACGLAALGAWGLLGGTVGLLAAGLVLVAGPRLLAGLDATADEDSIVARDLPLALDLLAACLTGGAVAADAVRAVAQSIPGPCGVRLATVAARLAVGSPPAEAWGSLGTDRGAAGAAARAMSRAAEGGAPVAAAVRRVAQDARRDSRARAEQAARRAGVLAVAPLGLCFLPAFLLIGVVPAVVGLATPLLSSL